MDHRTHASHLITIYYAQLALNYLWTPLYFGLKQVGLELPVPLPLVPCTYL
jgi:tryptophan-rich sensory protein